ncbi:Choline/ethanolaminephosphotransferase, partial [Neoconidiobolus thromboides FSU 785]
FIDPKYKKNLSLYKYKGVDNSLLSKYVLNHYWTWLVSLFPLWMAPNLITLLGFILIIFNFGLCLIFDPTLDGQGPAWLYVSYGVGLWIYASFDAIDGKQARRTGTSGPLGQLFDHSCDALNTTLVGLLTISAFKISKDWWSIISVYTAFGNFYLTTWEEYHTGTLYLSYFSGPVEGLTSVCILFILTGYVTPSYWTQDVRTILHLKDTTLPFIPSIEINKLFLLIAFFVMFLNIINSAYNVIQTYNEKKQSSITALLGILPFAVASLLGYLWISASPFIFTECLVPFMLFLGFTVAYNVGLIILAHVTKAPFPYFNKLYVPLIVGAINSNLSILFDIKPIFEKGNEITYIYACMLFSIGYYLYYSISVINEICDHFDIYCLSIK